MNFLEYCVPYFDGGIVGIHLDLENGTLEFSKNGEKQGIAFNVIKSKYRLAIAVDNLDNGLDNQFEIQ